MYDFKDGNGPVPAARHINPDGSEGGWVSAEAYVAPEVRLDYDAMVYGKNPYAQVFGYAEVFGNTRGDARVFDNARVSGKAKVFFNTHAWCTTTKGEK